MASHSSTRCLLLPFLPHHFYERALKALLFPFLTIATRKSKTFSKGGVLLVFTSPIVTSSVTRPLDNVFAGTGDEGELAGDMAIVPSVI